MLLIFLIQSPIVPPLGTLLQEPTPPPCCPLTALVSLASLIFHPLSQYGSTETLKFPNEVTAIGKLPPLKESLQSWAAELIILLEF